MSGRTWRLSAASVLVAALIGPASPRPATASGPRVAVGNLQFTPARLQVSVGDMVVWDGEDDGGHTVTARDGTFDSSSRGLMGYGDEFRYRFRVPGSYPYFCRVHQNRGMQGEIVVVDPSAPTTTTLRSVPVTAAATTSSTLAATPTTGAPTTTTTRPLATSSTTSVAMATPSTIAVGDPVDPQVPPTLNPAAPVVGSPAPASGLPASQAAAHRSGGSDVSPALAVGLGALLLVVLAGVGGGLRRRARRGRTG